MGDAKNLDVDKPLWDMNTFLGRFKYYFWMTDPRTVFTSEKELLKAKQLVLGVRANTVTGPVSQQELLHARKLYESAFHPDSGELQNVFGRMSFQVPGGMIITGAMLQFYRTIPAVVFWQWVNQSFNALVNYTNRNANSPTSVKQMGIAYVSATSSALITAIGCKNFWQKRASQIMQRYVPFAAVAAANCVNIPLMRQNEIINGIEVQDENGRVVGRSRLAAIKGISQVITSRIAMCAPGMLTMPIIMEKLEKIPAFKRATATHAPFQTVMVGGFLFFMVPVACALFPQNCSMDTSTIKAWEPELYEEMLRKTEGKVPEKVYFNKGL